MKNPQTVLLPVQAVDRIFTHLSPEAEDRLVRMRVIDYDGEVDGVGIDALCVTLGATLYDNLCESGADVEEVYGNLVDLFFDGEIIGAYLYLCAQYGMLGEPVPEQIMLLPTHRESLSTFIEALFIYFEDYLIADGIIDGSNDSTENESDEPDSGKVIHCVVTFVTPDSGRV